MTAYVLSFIFLCYISMFTKGDNFGDFLLASPTEIIIHVISPDFGGSSRFGAFPHGLTLGRRNLPTRDFSNVIFLGPYFSPNILSFTAVSAWRINCLQLKSV